MTLTEAAANLQKASVGLLKQREKDTLARKHKKKFAAFFRVQKGQVMQEMSARAYLFSESFRRLSEESPIDFTIQNWDRLWEEIAARTTNQLQEAVAASEADGLITGASQLKRMFNSATSFNLANPRAVAWFAQNGGSVDRIAGIQRTTGDQIKTIMTNALDNGWSYNQTAKEISDKFDEFSRDRAERIAVNETTQAYEEGNYLFAKAIEDDGTVMTKAWNVSNDERVCERCRANAAVGYIPIDEAFPSGDQLPPLHLGDRCFITYQAASA